MTLRPTPSPLQAHLGYWLRLVSNAVSHGFARRLEAEGVTVAEWVFLRALQDAGRVAPSQLAEAMGMTRGAISRLADRLLDKALIERRANPEDARGHSLALNQKGRALVPRLAALADANDAAFFGGLSAAEHRRLARLLRKLAADHALTAPPLD